MPELYWRERHTQVLNEPLPVAAEGAVYSVNLSTTMPLYSHIVRVVASAAVSIKRWGHEDDVANAPGQPMLWEFAVRQYGPPTRTSGQPIHFELGACRQAGAAVVARNPPGGSFGTVIETVATYEAQPSLCNARRSDGSTVDPAGVQQYTLQLICSPLSPGGMTLNTGQHVSAHASLRVLFEHDGPPPADD